uniref:Uncharacterized protein n=1 Tax=Lepeophtheirus salmonis TaxID=72036 RepID=A0A0K2T1N7_LEPSM
MFLLFFVCRIEIIHLAVTKFKEDRHRNELIFHMVTITEYFICLSLLFKIYIFIFSQQWKSNQQKGVLRRQ